MEASHVVEIPEVLFLVHLETVKYKMEESENYELSVLLLIFSQEMPRVFIKILLKNNV